MDGILGREMRSTGQRLADWVTKWVGSWWFVAIVVSYLLTWIALNLHPTFDGKWDPYPFIILNLTLSTFAALHASIILMSQKRHGDRDSLRMEHDYLIDKKTEKEIKQLQIDVLQIKQAVLKESTKGQVEKIRKEFLKIESELNEMESKMGRK